MLVKVCGSLLLFILLFAITAAAFPDLNGHHIEKMFYGVVKIGIGLFVIAAMASALLPSKH